MTMLEQDRPLQESPGTAPERGPHYGTIVFGAVLVVSGGLWFFDAIGAVDIRMTVILPAALATVGAALIVGSRDGPHTGLVVAGLFVAAAVLVAAIAPSGPVDGAIGTRSFVVTSAVDLEPTYEVGIGDLLLDLSDLRVERATEIRAEVGAGRLVVELPRGVPLLVEGTVGIGDLRMPDQTNSGLGLSHTFETDGYTATGSGITLVADVGVGQLEVTR